MTYVCFFQNVVILNEVSSLSDYFSYATFYSYTTVNLLIRKHTLIPLQV